MGVHNEEYRRGEHTWWMEANYLADFTEDEFHKLRMTRDSFHRARGVRGVEISTHQPNTTANPTSVEWRSSGELTAVKSQGCGNCWAFAATETLESHYDIATGKLLTLAPQAIVNCAKNPKSCGGTGGCDGATAQIGFEVAKEQGIPLEADYPYVGHDGTCSSYTASMKATGYVTLPSNNALALETALATKGPIAVSVDASSWMLYGGGILTQRSASSSGFTINHAVQAV